MKSERSVCLKESVNVTEDYSWKGFCSWSSLLTKSPLGSMIQHLYLARVSIFFLKEKPELYQERNKAEA